MAILATSIIMWAGAMAYYDFPQIYSQFLLPYFDIKNLDIEYLYSSVQIPNIFLPFLASFIMAKTGLAIGNLIFQLLILIGIFFNFVAVSNSSFLYMIIGRAIFGVGTEIVFVAQGSITDKWFNGRFLSVAFSLNRFMTYTFVSVSTYYLPNLFVSSVESAKKDGLTEHG